MSPRSTRLAGPLKVVSGTSPVLYTCPTGKVALVKSIRLVNQTGAVVGALLGLNSVSNDHVVLQVALAAKGTYIDPDTDPIVLAAEETVWAGDTSSIGVGDFRVTLSGAELDA